MHFIFSLSFYQGRTIERLILDLNKWPKGKLTHPHILVGLTRVRDLSHVRSVIESFCLCRLIVDLCVTLHHCRTMPMLPGQSRKHLYKLRADCEMLAFLQGFNTSDGKWSPAKAHKALQKSGKNAVHKGAQQRSAPSTVTPRKPSASSSTSNPSSTSRPSTAQKRPRTPAAPTRSRMPPRRESSRFSIASEGRISNMQPFRRQFKSFENSGHGDCLFESFRQSLNIPESVLEMRNKMVERFETASDQTRVVQLNEHIMRELDAHNENYMGYGDLHEGRPQITMQSNDFSALWAQYVHDMVNDAAYAGGAEAAALADIYKVNVTVWAHHQRSGTATHLTTHLQTPPSDRTVHLLNINNVHYESTDLPMESYPLISDPVHQSAICAGLRSAQKPPLPNLSTLPQVTCLLKFKGFHSEFDNLLFQHVLPSTAPAADAAGLVQQPSPQRLSPPQASTYDSCQQVAKQFHFFTIIILTSLLHNAFEERRHWLCVKRPCKTRSPQ